MCSSRLLALFRETFDRDLEPITAGSIAQALSADPNGDAGLLAASFEKGRFTTAGQSDGAPSILAWSGDDQTGLDYLGNEFMVWIWHSLQNSGGTITLADKSEVSVVLAKTLVLDCPRGETGRDQLADDVPTRLPEALRALAGGQAAAPVGDDPGPPGCAVRADAAGRELCRFGGGAAEARRRVAFIERISGRAARESAPSDRNDRPAVRSVSRAADIKGLAARAFAHTRLAAGGVTAGQGEKHRQGHCQPTREAARS